MSAHITPQSLQAFEHWWLSRLEEQINDVSAQITAWTPSDHTFTTEQVTFLIDFLVGVEKSFQLYEPQARYLDERGFPHLSRRLSEIVSDVRGAREIYTQKRQSHLAAAQPAMADVQRQAAEECLRIFKETTKRRQDEVDTAFERWRAATFPDPVRPRLCPHCRLPLGGPHSYAVCPYARRIIYD